MRLKALRGFASVEIAVVAMLLVGLGAIVANVSSLSGDVRSNAAESERTSVFSLGSPSDIVNEDGSSLSGGPGAWLGNGISTGSSYLGIKLRGTAIPKSSHIQSAKLEFTQPKTEWISVGFDAFIEMSAQPADFAVSAIPSSRTLSSVKSSFSDNVKWESGKKYDYDITAPLQEFVNSYESGDIVLILKGTGGSWARKFIYDGTNGPRLEVVYTSLSTTTTASATATATATVTSTATATSTTTAISSPTEVPVETSSSLPVPPGSDTGIASSDIYGAVPDSLLGTCTHEVHDRYVTRGPDGRLYRTWHPTTVPVDANNPGGAKCSFAHEHGDDPSTSHIYSGPVPFSYIGSNIGIDMPHAGYKCFVHNKGQTNDEGSVALHDTYYCFHMGTSGVGRYTARFHELYFHIRSASGYVMNIQGLADTGGDAGTICDSPRHGRTVQGLGCKIDSAYEIWANDLRINNRGNTVAFAETSTAVFDPITTMDPSDKTRLLYSWDPVVSSSVFKFSGNRSNFRGCEREAYSGPVRWYNRGGSNIYYTDVYGNVVDGGPLKQEVSTINTNSNSGYIDQYGGLIMTYKSGNQSEPQSQYKYKKSACVPGLGLNN